ncbi:MAG TPA: glycoside hydrolase family 2 TIM barrel-domain containing protein [Candidatus Xenobia bacterium]|jgi:beta-mannosidase
MKFKAWLFFLLCSAPLCAQPLDGPWRYLPMEGPRDLSRFDVDDRSWPQMTLPSNWFLKGQKVYPVANDLSPASQGKVGDPGELGSPQLDRGLDYEGTVWFRRHFQWGTGRAVLRFESVDYFADVYVNGHLVGSHEGCFEPFEFDVSKWAHAGDNLLAVKVSAPALVFDWSETWPISWPKHQGFIKGIFAYHDTRPGGTTVRGQERGTGGILGEVSIRRAPDVEVERLQVAPDQVSAASAVLHLDCRLHNWSSKTRSIVLDGSVAPANFAGVPVKRMLERVEVPSGVDVDCKWDVTVKQPHLWWSWDYGLPNLYRWKVNGTFCEFGIRSVTHDANWVWSLNGVRIFPRGTNYISTQWLSQTDRDWYARDVGMMKACNLNSVRVHAHLENPEFYRQCDEAGLMVWQDFPLQWGFTDDAGFRREALRQVDAMIARDFNHPSIIVWCLHNESPHASAWMRKKDPQQNLALDNALVAEAQRQDRTRVCHRDSGTGDGHVYDGWYGDTVARFRDDKVAPFLTEYGAEALPGIDTLKTMFPPDKLWPPDWDTWAYHNFQYEQTFNVAKVPKGDTLEQFVENSQNYQAALLKYSTELFRRRKWHGMTGIYQFMFVDDWPSITWSVVDYYRKPKKGYLALQTAMQPVLPSIEYSVDKPDDPVTLWVVNDRHQAYRGARLEWNGGSATVDVPDDGVVRVQSIGPWQGVLHVRLVDRDGHPLGENSLSKEDFVTWQK